MGSSTKHSMLLTPSTTLRPTIEDPVILKSENVEKEVFDEVYTEYESKRLEWNLNIREMSMGTIHE